MGETPYRGWVGYRAVCLFSCFLGWLGFVVEQRCDLAYSGLWGGLNSLFSCIVITGM